MPTAVASQGQVTQDHDWVLMLSQSWRPESKVRCQQSWFLLRPVRATVPGLSRASWLVDTSLQSVPVVTWLLAVSLRAPVPRDQGPPYSR